MDDECHEVMENGCVYDHTQQALCHIDEFLGNDNEEQFNEKESKNFRFFSIP